MDRLRAYEVFVSIVSQQSFTKAASTLGTSPANVTRYLNELEAHLGTRLLNRTSRSLSLTDAGQTLYDRSKSLLQELAEAETLAADPAKPRGRLRINASVTFGVRYLAPLWPTFMERYPDVELDVVLNDKTVDLVGDGCDMAVRISRGGSTNYVARKLATSHDVVCASPAYLRRNGSPQVPADLGQHSCVGYTYAPKTDEWRFTDNSGKLHAVRIKTSLQSNSCDAGRAAALAGAGIILQPFFMVGDDIREGRLVSLLQAYHLPEVDVSAVYPNRRHLSPKVRVMVDFLVEAFKEGRPWVHSVIKPPVFESARSRRGREVVRQAASG